MASGVRRPAIFARASGEASLPPTRAPSAATTGSRGGCAGAAAASRIGEREPPPACALSTPMLPPGCSTIRYAVERPSPVPLPRSRREARFEDPGLGRGVDADARCPRPGSQPCRWKARRLARRPGRASSPCCVRIVSRPPWASHRWHSSRTQARTCSSSWPGSAMTRGRLRREVDVEDDVAPEQPADDVLHLVDHVVRRDEIVGGVRPAGRTRAVGRPGRPRDGPRAGSPRVMPLVASGRLLRRRSA